jgi:hypothetical protein
MLAPVIQRAPLLWSYDQNGIGAANALFEFHH